MKKILFIHRFMQFLEKRRHIYFAGMLGRTIFEAIFDVVASIMMKNVFDTAIDGNYNKFVAVLLLSVIIGVASIIGSKICQYYYNMEAKRAYANMQKKVFLKTMKFPMSFYDNCHSGKLVSSFIYDTDRATEIYTSRLRRVVAPILSLFVYFIVMVRINFALSLVLIMFNLMLVSVNSLFSAPMKKIAKKSSIVSGNMTEKLTDIVEGMEVIRIFDQNKKIAESYKEICHDFACLQSQKGIVSAILDAVNKGFDLMCSILFIFAGLFFIKAGYAQMGDVAAIYIMYTALSEKFMQVGKYYPELMNCVTYAEKLMDFLESKEDEEFININDIKTNRKMNINTVSSAIQFRDVSFSYNNDRKILNHLSFDIQPNENVAIIGKSGTGKSTIAKLMLGYYKQQSGEIYIFDKTFESWGLETVRKLIAYVPQEAYLFETTIMENIRYGNIHASDHDVIEAAKAANAHSFIMKVHDKYLYKICQRGSNLSGGERQRVAIARAIIKNTPIIIFDEATSALDGESEMAINDSITKLKKTKTIITIAHRQNTIDMADRKVEIVI